MQRHKITAFDILTNALIGALQKKCEMYWPESVDMSVDYGDVAVTLVDVKLFGDYVQRTMKIRHSVNNAYCKCNVRHFL